MNMIKFAVWGIGQRGKGVIRKWKDKVACIVESNIAYHNTYYEDIPIIGFEDYVNLYSGYPIIITPKGAEHDIKQALNRKEIYHVICFSEYVKLMNSFGIPTDRFFGRYDKNRKIIIYGGSFLGYFLYDYLIEKGYLCKLVLQSGYLGKLAFEIDLAKWKEELVKEAQIILTLPLAEIDRIELERAGIEYEKYYEDIFSRDFYYYPQLECFKDIHCGKRCFIVATGPSLRIEDLNKLHQNKETCFGVNRVFSAFDRTEWRPDYYMVGDIDAVMKWKKEIIEIEAKEKFIADIAWQFEEKEIKGNMHTWHVFRNWAEGELPQFSDDFARGTFTGRTITYDGALQLAVYMGFSEIYLLGVDCNYQRGGKNNYFFEEKERDTIDHRENEMILAYRAAEEYAKSHGIKIYNATRGGMLEEFERVDFDSLFEEAI